MALLQTLARSDTTTGTSNWRTALMTRQTTLTGQFSQQTTTHQTTYLPPQNPSAQQNNRLVTETLVQVLSTEILWYPVATILLINLMALTTTTTL